MIEGRRHVRVLITAPARLLLDGRHVFDCTVRDLSVGGACLEVTNNNVPDEFDLMIHGGNVYLLPRL